MGILKALFELFSRQDLTWMIDYILTLGEEAIDIQRGLHHFKVEISGDEFVVSLFGCMVIEGEFHQFGSLESSVVLERVPISDASATDRLIALVRQEWFIAPKPISNQGPAMTAHEEQRLTREQSNAPGFVVHEAWQGQMVIQLNQPMARLLARFIDEVDDSEGIERPIVAFKLALMNPSGRPCRSAPCRVPQSRSVP